MRLTALLGLVLTVALASAAQANTVPVHRYHRRAHHPVPSARAATSAHAARAKSATKSGTTAHTTTAHAGKTTTATAGRTATARRASTVATHGRRATTQTVHMSRRYPASRRRASLRRVSFRLASPLAGSRESLIHQNEMAEAEGLERIQDDADLNNRIASGALVPVPVDGWLRINVDLPENRRYCRPWTADFLRALAEAHAGAFPSSPLEVTSAVRTVEYQRRLQRVNGNAAAADGDLASPHLTGGTIDLGKKGMSRREIAWMRNWLMPLQQAGKIDVEEEFRQSCFHISVYKSFDGDAPDLTEPDATHPADTHPAATLADAPADAPGH